MTDDPPDPALDFSVEGMEGPARGPKAGGGRPKDGYVLIDGTPAPGVTTILGRFKDSAALMGWAWKMGRQGKRMDEARDSAASVGSVVHDAIEAWVLAGGRPCEEVHAILYAPRPEWAATARQMVLDGFDAFKDWWHGMRPQILETEVPLVSETHRYGGTLDGVGVISGRLCLLDWKTSNAIYPEYLAQLGAYSILWEEHRKRPFEGFHLLRVSKNTGAFHHSHWRQVDRARRYFLTLREAYDYDREVREMLK